LPMGRKSNEFDGDPRVVSLLGVEFFVDWDRVQVGSSVFLPTIATPKQVEDALAPIVRHLGIKTAVRTRVEYGRYGARVWRLS
jgi:hypothetical protein